MIFTFPYLNRTREGFMVTGDFGNDEQARVRSALDELARICSEGSRSGRLSNRAWMNHDAWQNAYLALAPRIAAGRVDLDRPLRGLAYVTARNFYISECRREGRCSRLTEDRVHRYNAGEERLPEEQAEASRRGAVLRECMVELAGRGKLSETDVAILVRRYVDEWSVSEVARSVRLTADNVRQISLRRRQLLRKELEGRELEEPVAA